MKKNNYMVPQTEVMDFEFESLMKPDSLVDNTPVDGVLGAPGRGGYLEPAY